MDISFIFGKIWGILLITSSLAFMLNRQILDLMKKLVVDEGFVVISGYLSLLMGIITITFHNIWSLDWRIIITLLGWLALIKGFIRLSSPESIKDLSKSLLKESMRIHILLLILLALGVYLFYCGYFFQSV